MKPRFLLLIYLSCFINCITFSVAPSIINQNKKTSSSIVYIWAPPLIWPVCIFLVVCSDIFTFTFSQTSVSDFFSVQIKTFSNPKHFNRVIHLFTALLATKWRLLIELCKLARLIKCKIEIMNNGRAYSDWWKTAWKEKRVTSFKICLFWCQLIGRRKWMLPQNFKKLFKTLFGYNHCFQTLNRLQANSKLPCLFAWRIN